MAFGIDRLAREIAEDVEARIRVAHEACPAAVESPIERLFFTAMRVAPRFFNAYTGLDAHPSLNLVPTRAEFDEVSVLMGMQVRAIDWPVDFLISARRDADDGVFHLVVECDGHDFHERTKQQAARDRSRDRALQARGFTVMRFTGSEIYRDPLKCASEALDWCLGNVWGSADQ